MIVQKSVVTNWLKTAAIGEKLVYARATFLPVKSEVAKMLRQAEEDGHVILSVQRRMHGPGDENFRYIAKRTAKPFPGRLVAVKGGKPVSAYKPQDKRIDARASLQREIVPQVRALMAEGVRSGAAIARELGLYSPEPVHNLMRRLAA